MPLTISESVLNDTGYDGPAFLVEIACQLYAAQKISRPAARRLANLSQGAFEEELMKRNIPVYQIVDEVGFDDLKRFREGKI